MLPNATGTSMNNKSALHPIPQKGISGVLCNGRMNLKIKRKVYKTVFRPAVLCMGGNEGTQKEVSVAQMRMLHGGCAES